MLCMTNGTLLYYGKVRFASTSSWMPLAQRTRLQKLYAWFGTIRKHNLQRMNARPYPEKQSMEQSQNTISKEWTQDHIHRRKMSTVLLWIHLCIHSKIAILPQFLTSNVNFVRKVTMDTSIAILPQFLTSNVHFARKGCDWHLKIAILLQFLTSNVHFSRKGCDGWTKIAILRQFLTSNVDFVRKGCSGRTKIAILPRFWTSDVHEMLRLSRFVALRRRRPRLKREIERRARERKEEREKICRCEGVKM